MKFTIRVRARTSGREHDETYEKSTKEVGGDDEAAIRNWAEKTLESFNDTLYPNEEPRDLVSVTLDDPGAIAEHSWRKTSLAGQADGDGAIYDKMRCENCGMTARRYGIDQISVDKLYKWRGVLKRPFQRCDTAKAFLDAGGNPRNTTKRRKRNV
ncbi:MAG: hypothetical protein V3W44_07310 [Dehalococcoidales bacterium]